MSLIAICGEFFWFIVKISVKIHRDMKWIHCVNKDCKCISHNEEKWANLERWIWFIDPSVLKLVMTKKIFGTCSSHCNQYMDFYFRLLLVVMLFVV